MANTTNFGWETPDDTDLVKDGAAAMRTLGSAIDTSMMDLKGGTTDQVLAKNSNTDMDFKWVTSDDANAIQNAIVDAKGDLITATAADTPARLAVGTNGQVLQADSTTATGLKWGSVSTTFSATTHTLTFAPFGFTEGNSTKSSYYVDFGDVFLFSGYVKVGSTAVAGTLRVVPPFNIRDVNPTAILGSLNIFYDASAAKSYLVQPLYQGTDKIGFDYLTANTTYVERAGELNGVITLATNDELWFQVICRKA